jgi:O-methyltransferase
VWKRTPPFFLDVEFNKAFDETLSFSTDQLRLMDIRWRASVCCWAAKQALLAEGDFVECGVNTGILSGTICRLMDFSKISRKFWLFDTYEGIPIELASESERSKVSAYNTQYPDVWLTAQANFASFPNANLVRGRVPASLSDAKIDKVSYLSIDMNIEAPERAALEYFWPKLSAGGIVILDDYGFTGHEEQRRSADEFAASVGVGILALPTGQGLIVKPAMSKAK